MSTETTYVMPELSVGDTVYLPYAPMEWNQRTPYTVVATTPCLFVTCDGASSGVLGPYEITPEDAAALGLTSAAPPPGMSR